MYAYFQMKPAVQTPLASGPDEAAIVTKAMLRAAERLALPGRLLARIVGVSEPTLSRLRAGATELERQGKPFELAVLFIRLYRTLDAIAGGDGEVARAWLTGPNTALNGVPLELIQTIPGLLDVIAYLDARRALV